MNIKTELGKGYADVKKIDIEAIPVINVSSLFSNRPDYISIGGQLRSAAETTGFFYISHHCIDNELIHQAFDLSQRFFASDKELKNEVSVNPYHRGLLQVGVSKMEGQARSDLKESYLWGLDVAEDNEDFLAGNIMLPANQWPSFFPEMRDILNRYMAAAHQCGKELLRAIAVNLNIDQEYFTRYFDKPITRGSLIYYPHQTKSLGIDQYGVSPHTDYGTLTLLAQDNTGGLRIRDRNGDWLTAHPVGGTLVVNVGDLLARWSNDRFKSTEHAVINNSGKERYSIAIALDPNWETPIKPIASDGETPKYEEVLCGEYIQGRFDQSFSYRVRNQG